MSRGLETAKRQQFESDEKPLSCAATGALQSYRRSTMWGVGERADLSALWRWGLVLLLALPAWVRAADDEPPVVLRFGWSQRAATEAGFVLQLGPLKLPETSRSYLKIAETGQARPVFLTGHGRRGTLEFSMKFDRLQGGYAITTRGAPVIEFADESGGPKWRLTVQRVHGATGTEGLRAWLARRHKPMDKRDGEFAPPAVRWQAKLDVELRSPTGTVALRDRPAELTMRVIEAELWGYQHIYWDLTVTTTLPTPTGEIRAVMGTVDWIPKDVLLEGAPELAEMDGKLERKSDGGETE